eukprot:m.11187 g.11187  ORF g.11187 m.11187 type:complete len:277 (-) comp4396_c0_seq1:508-1338(-)
MEQTAGLRFLVRVKPNEKDSVVRIVNSTLTVEGTLRCDNASSFISQEIENEKLFEELIPPRINAFMEGFNVNILAYGQTGSGKTHTVFGPPGCMQRASTGEFGMDAWENYGILPRAILKVFKHVNLMNSKQEQRLYLISCGAIELSVTGTEDMFHKSAEKGHMRLDSAGIQKGILIDDCSSPPKVCGHEEFVLESEKDILRFFGVLAKRNTRGTKMNSSSSRSHCIIWLHLYCLERATQSITKSKFQFCDLAGSERIQEAHGTKIFLNVERKVGRQ